MKSYYSSILIYFITACISSTFDLIQGATALQAPVGLISTAAFLATATANHAPDEQSATSLRFRGRRNAVQVPNEESCGGRGPCTNGATCIDEVCECSPGWIPDPLIFPVFDAGWLSCVDHDECAGPVKACNDIYAECVDYAPPVRFVCVCPAGFTTLPSDSTASSTMCVLPDDSSPPTNTPSSAPEETPSASKEKPTPQETPTVKKISCTRECNSPKEFCINGDGTKGVDWPKCTCNQHFQRNANGDSCRMIQYCDSEESAQKSCPAPGTNCIQHGGEGGYFCMCMDGHVGGPNSEEGCVLTPAPTTSTPSLVPSFSLAPSIAPTTAAPTPAPTPAPISACAALVCPTNTVFESNAKLTAAVVEFNTDPSDLEPMNCWDVSKMTDMSNVFSKTDNLNEDIFCWDVSNVTSMARMFFKAAAFNKPLNSWDVSKLTNATGMFSKSVFDQPLNAWDVSKVTNTDFMFSESKFDQPLNAWDVSKVTDMKDMFSQSVFTQPLNGWDVSKVTDMKYMFSQSVFDQPLNGWDVSKVTNMKYMFSQSIFDQPLNAWDVSKVTNMNRMFSEAVFDQPLNAWDVSKVTTMLSMFFKSKFDQPLNAWDVSKVTIIHSMFKGSVFNQDLCTWGSSNLPAIANVEDMFKGSGCDKKRDPDFTKTPPGPFCYQC